jgi:hypothetical protein
MIENHLSPSTHGQNREILILKTLRNMVVAGGIEPPTLGL